MATGLGARRHERGRGLVMRCKSWWTVTLLVFVGGCELYLGVGEGKLRECRVVDDCAVELPDCRSVLSCTASRCAFHDEAEGTPLSTELQTPGDCLEWVCDGAGDKKLAQSPSDADDGNPCTIDECKGSVQVHTKQNQVKCYEGPPGTQDVGECKPGTLTCDGDGNPVGLCEGEVIPFKVDICGNGFDDECDGLTDDEACICGDGKLSTDLGEECDDGNNDNVDGCSSSCKREVVISIVTGAFHTCALLTGGSVKCWGRNDFGQLGIGEREHRGDNPNEMASYLPQVSLGKDRYATALTAGAFHTCALLDDGSVKCWGLNGIGQLGLGYTKTRGDELNEMGDDLPTVDVGTGMSVVAIAAGAYHTCALLSDKASVMSVKCWGANASGQLGMGDTMPRGRKPVEMGEALSNVELGNGVSIASISAGDYFTCAILSNGSVKCWGENGVGQLGQGGTSDRGDNPQEVGDELPPILLGTGINPSSLAPGSAHVCALLGSPGVKCWGGNWKGQLGFGDVTHRGNALGQMGDSLPFVDLGMSTVSQIVAGHSFTCAIMANGVVKCWGSNESGQLGIGDSYNRGDQPGEMGGVLPVVELGQKATMIAAGDTHACALLEDGNVKCWGGNTYGQLGMGDTSHRGDESGETLSSVKLFQGEW